MIEYARFQRGTDLDANRESLDNKAIEVDVTELRESSTNPSLFPAGTDKNDFTAYSVTAAEGETRTRLSIVVKDDTSASKLARSRVPTDKLRVRGSAHITGSVNGLSILVDAMDLAQ